MTTARTRRSGASALGSMARKRSIRIAAATTAFGVAVTAVASSGGGAAGAATLPQAQSVGNFLDATLGGNTLDAVVALDYASAKSPGTQSVQNPLNATVLNAVTLPLTGTLQLPELLGINLGAVNQVAVAKASGRSYGASGAVNNSGGVSVGGNNAAFPADATIDLTANGIAGSSPIPIPGGTGSADALGGVQAKVGAVHALAQTPVGYGKPGTTSYGIASLDLQLASPLVGGVLGTVAGTLNTVLGTLATAAGQLGLPAACSFTDGLSSITLENGAIVIDAATGSITIHLKELLQTLLGKDLNALPANTDLLAFLLNYLTSPAGLAAGLTGVINGLTNPLASKFTACLTALQNNGPIGQIAGLLLTLTNALTAGQTTLENTIGDIVTALAGAAGVSPLAPLGTLLGQLIGIGVNVQPNGPAGTFTSALDATPKQGTPVVADQTIVRAIELDVLGGNGAVVALANAAAGPSTAPAAPPSSATPEPTSTVPGTTLPTGVPAGMGTHDGSPVLPVVLLLLALTFAGGGVVAYRTRAKFTH
ncbi:MAG: hypothetical protein QOG01_4806 [Pseudonocardiales bacterium]|nr:hypothetical protein [Pseudonocardiales bacterium]